MQNLSLVDETFDLSFTPEYILSILVSQDGFSFSILDRTQNKVVYLSHHDTYTNEAEFQHKKIIDIYNESDLLHRPFSKTYIHFSTPGNISFIPAKLFNKEKKKDLYTSVFELDQKLQILSSFYPEINQYALYGINTEILQTIQKKHPGIAIENEINISIKRFRSNEKTMVVQLFRKYLNIIFFSPELTFANSFLYEGENDLLYYILGTCKTTGQEPATLYLEGMVNKHAEIYHRLRQYFENVRIAENNPNIHYSYLLDKLPDARFVSLFNSF